MEDKTYMAINQYGDTYHNLKHPRKELCAKLGYKHADKMFMDNKDGQPVHIGYVIGGEWLTLYEVRPFRREE